MARLKKLSFREAALADVEQAVQWHAEAKGLAIALQLIDALEEAYARIARFPSSGSPHWAEALRIPGLRASRLTGFDYLVFYVDLEVWRVLHVARDPGTTLKGLRQGGAART